MADPKKSGDDELYTFPKDFVVNGDCGPHAEQLRGTISPWTPEGVPEAETQAQDRVWVITNMKADRRTIVEGKVFVSDSGAIVGMDFAGKIDKIDPGALRHRVRSVGIRARRGVLVQGCRGWRRTARNARTPTS